MVEYVVQYCMVDYVAVLYGRVCSTVEDSYMYALCTNYTPIIQYYTVHYNDMIQYM